MDLNALSATDRRHWHYAKLAAFACVATAGFILTAAQAGSAHAQDALIAYLLQ